MVGSQSAIRLPERSERRDVLPSPSSVKWPAYPLSSSTGLTRRVPSYCFKTPKSSTQTAMPRINRQPGPAWLVPGQIDGNGWASALIQRHGLGEARGEPVGHV